MTRIRRYNTLPPMMTLRIRSNSRTILILIIFLILCSSSTGPITAVHGQESTNSPSPDFFGFTEFPSPDFTGWPTFDTLEPTTEEPTINPTRQPTRRPTKEPTRDPTRQPTEEPTQEPTRRPTRDPTRRPTEEPTREPTREPTQDPTKSPITREPISTLQPTNAPTAARMVPSASPISSTQEPTPTTREPTRNPTRIPTKGPTTLVPTGTPTRVPPPTAPILSGAPLTAAPTSSSPTEIMPSSSRPVSKPSLHPSADVTSSEPTTIRPVTIPPVPTTGVLPSFHPSTDNTATPVFVSVTPAPSPLAGRPSLSPIGEEQGTVDPGASTPSNGTLTAVDTTISDIFITFGNVGEMTVFEINNLQDIMETWFDAYFNNNGPSSSKSGRRRRALQAERPAAADVRNMRSFITVTSQNGALSDMNNTITYNQLLSYEALPTAKLPSELIGLPFEDENYNLQLAESLRQQLAAFSNLTGPIGIPVVTESNNDGDSSDRASSDADRDIAIESSTTGAGDGIGTGAIVGIVVGILVAVGVLVGFACYSNAAKRRKREVQELQQQAQLQRQEIHPPPIPIEVGSTVIPGAEQQPPVAAVTARNRDPPATRIPDYTDTSAMTVEAELLMEGGGHGRAGCYVPRFKDQSREVEPPTLPPARRGEVEGIQDSLAYKNQIQSDSAAIPATVTDQFPSHVQLVSAEALPLSHEQQQVQQQGTHILSPQQQQKPPSRLEQQQQQQDELPPRGSASEEEEGQQQQEPYCRADL